MLSGIKTGRVVKKTNKGLEWHKVINTALLMAFGNSDKQASRTYLYHMPYAKRPPRSPFLAGPGFQGEKALHPLPTWCHSAHVVCVDSRIEERTYIVYQPIRVGNCPLKVTVGLLQGFIFLALVFLSC